MTVLEEIQLGLFSTDTTFRGQKEYDRFSAIAVVGCISSQILNFNSESFDSMNIFFAFAALDGFGSYGP